MSAEPELVPVKGFASPGFERVRDAFAENCARRKEPGAACAVYLHGEKVVDLWGGVRDGATGEPWEEDTMTLVFSTTKGMAAVTTALAHSRSWLDYDEPVSTYWPEFAQNGKEQITVRQLLAHQAGLFGCDEPVNVQVIADLDRLAGIMARQKPEWEAGTLSRRCPPSSRGGRRRCCQRCCQMCTARGNARKSSIPPLAVSWFPRRISLPDGRGS